MTTTPAPRIPADLKLRDLATVRFDRDVSTKWIQIYHADSDRGVAVYEVHHLTRDDDGRRYRPEYWRCNCPASGHRSCKHRLRAWGYEQARWWRNLFADYTPAMLWSMADAKASLIDADLDADDSRAALLAIAGLLRDAGEMAA